MKPMACTFNLRPFMKRAGAGHTLKTVYCFVCTVKSVVHFATQQNLVESKAYSLK